MRALSVLLCLLALSAAAQSSGGAVPALGETSPAVFGAGSTPGLRDVALWLHPSDPSRSLVLVATSFQGVVAYRLDGGIALQAQTIVTTGVDVRYVPALDGGTVGVIATAEGDAVGLYALDDPQVGSPALRLLGTVGAGALTVSPIASVDLYRSVATGELSLFVGDGAGRFQQVVVTFPDGGSAQGASGRTLQVVGVPGAAIADDENGAFLVLARDQASLSRFAAEPDAGTVAQVVSLADAGLDAGLEGLALYRTQGGGGYVLVADTSGGNVAVLDRRVPDELKGRLTVDASVDGRVDAVELPRALATANLPLGPGLDGGVLVVVDGQNTGGGETVKRVSWADVARAFSPALSVDVTYDPRVLTTLGGADGGADGGDGGGGIGGGGGGFLPGPGEPATCGCTSASSGALGGLSLLALGALARRRRPRA